jgi:hypothetical protein
VGGFRAVDADEIIEPVGVEPHPQGGFEFEGFDLAPPDREP